MTTKERLTAALNGGTPDITPFSIYSFFMDDPESDRWRRLIDQGLGICWHTATTKAVEHGVLNSYQERIENGHRYEIYTKETPLGTLRQVFTDGWHSEYWIKEPSDYKVMQWIVEHTEILPDYDAFYQAEHAVGDDGVAIIVVGRTPAMSINVDLVGTEQFCLDLALEVPELFDLYEAKKRLLLDEIKIVADGPGRFVKWNENLTISMLGTRRYADLLVPVYEACVPVLEQGGKRVMVHYDGALDIIKDHIADAPFHMIESLTEPPEGDMTYDQCRSAWPDKAFWANINVECYHLPDEELKAAVAAKRERAGKTALAFEISEDLPDTWERTIPLVLETLTQLG